jgi:hypothetical protein
MLYTKVIISSFIVKYLKMKSNRNGASTNTIIQLKSGSQLRRFLNTFSLLKNSFIIWLDVGFTSSPRSSAQPYAGGSSTVFKKAIDLKGNSLKN